VAANCLRIRYFGGTWRTEARVHAIERSWFQSHRGILNRADYDRSNRGWGHTAAQCVEPPLSQSQRRLSLWAAVCWTDEKTAPAGALGAVALYHHRVRPTGEDGRLHQLRWQLPVPIEWTLFFGLPFTLGAMRVMCSRELTPDGVHIRIGTC
jgi:hypothetical protein